MLLNVCFGTALLDRLHPSCGIAMRVTVTDAGGLLANDVFTLTVNHVNDAPLTPPARL